ncbi:transcription initiation factor IIB, putative [Entamoeba invadens IP1]|uniref:Transcription initiation factor IIB, putative n=1 Tax=Entamoeba invadens IP1 TaxID=370355 RepID=L7FNI9_ENTIV|nr:transcription initiation factor IIB, putative [Entamoeba invadens IP1]ELP88555.1 transcription initiation factor IIB, putative [Entamoeba invadens IP1]|eukprot:XP_004255326.1 transcription initiation factor IIB, putative [Entamoeba invadens IP1]
MSRQKVVLCEDPRNKDRKCVPEEDHKRGQIYCVYCGRVIDKVLDEGQEWRSFDGDNSRNRLFYATAGQDTASMLKGCASTSQQTSAQNSKMNEFRREFNDYFQKISLSQSQTDHAMKFVQELYTLHAAEIHGKNKKKIIEGVVMMVCKEENCGFSSVVIAKQLGWIDSEVMKNYKWISRVLKKSTSDNFEAMIENYCREIKVGQLTIKCQEISELAKKILDGKKPATIAAVAICYVAENQGMLNQDLEMRIAATCGVSVANMKQVYKMLVEKKETLDQILAKA